MENIDMLDTLQEGIIESDKKNSEDKKKYNFDKLKMYFREDFTINNITISQPTIGYILEVGEENFYHALSPFLYNSTSIRVLLWEHDKDWNKVSDIEVFAIMMPSVINEFSYILDKVFNGFKFDDFQLFGTNNTETETKYALYSPSQNILIQEDEYMVIAEYIREMLNVHPKIEKAKGKTAKKWIIQEDKMNLLNKKPEEASNLLSLVSACVNHPGFKYKLEELKDVGIYQFMDSVKRIQKYESATAILNGSYSGFVDTSKLDKELFNFMGDI